MQAILLSREEVAQRAKLLYEESIQEQVEQEENIGKMVIIDIETGEYAVDTTGERISKDSTHEESICSTLRYQNWIQCCSFIWWCYGAH